MKPESISQERWDRLIGHLEKLEKVTKGKLRKTPRFDLMDCPVDNFAPNRAGAYKFNGVNREGAVSYYSFSSGSSLISAYKEKEFQIYTKADSNWWHCLPDSVKGEVTKQVAKWIKERK